MRRFAPLGVAAALMMATAAPLAETPAPAAEHPNEVLSAAQNPDKTDLVPTPASRERYDRESLRRLVQEKAEKFGIPGRADGMFSVVWRESKGCASARSRSGRHVGICQFNPSTFRKYVAQMRDAGVIGQDVEYSPADASQSVEVMAWMWSRGMQGHWKVRRHGGHRHHHASVSGRKANRRAHRHGGRG